MPADGSHLVETKALESIRALVWAISLMMMALWVLTSVGADLEIKNKNQKIKK